MPSFPCVTGCTWAGKRGKLVTDESLTQHQLKCKRYRDEQEANLASGLEILRATGVGQYKKRRIDEHRNEELNLLDSVAAGQKVSLGSPFKRK